MWRPGEGAGHQEAQVQPSPRGLGQDATGSAEDPTRQPLSLAWAPGRVQAGWAIAQQEEQHLSNERCPGRCVLRGWAVTQRGLSLQFQMDTGMPTAFPAG